MKTSKVIALMTAALMLVILTATAFAAPAAVNVTVPSNDNHTYEVYQIFTGDFEASDSLLANLHYGKNAALPDGKSVGDVVDISVVEAVAAVTGTEAQKAAALRQYANLSDPFGTVNKNGPLQVATGYYLIKDIAVGEGEEHTLYLMKIAGPTVIYRKAGSTYSDKRIDDKNDSDADPALNATYDISADHDIGDWVPYHVSATVSEKVENYPKYHIVIEDILEEGRFDGITLDKSAITIGGAPLADTATYTVTANWVREPSKDGFKVIYEFTPTAGNTLYELNGKNIRIDFTAKLGVNAVIGNPGNKNTLKVRYSNNPNEPDGASEGTTPDKIVKTFTHEIAVTKTDDRGNALGGAEFTLYKISAENAANAAVGSDAEARGAYWAEKAIKTYTAAAQEGATSGVSNVFRFRGIDDGCYVICETVTPGGYNTMEPIVFTVSAEHGIENGEIRLTSLTGAGSGITFVSDAEGGSLSATVTNSKGVVFPETGGEGTSLIYTLGSILLVGGGVLLITRRRVNKAD